MKPWWSISWSRFCAAGNGGERSGRAAPRRWRERTRWTSQYRLFTIRIDGGLPPSYLVPGSEKKFLERPASAPLPTNQLPHTHAHTRTWVPEVGGERPSDADALCVLTLIAVTKHNNKTVLVCIANNLSLNTAHSTQVHTRHGRGVQGETIGIEGSRTACAASHAESTPCALTPQTTNPVQAHCSNVLLKVKSTHYLCTMVYAADARREPPKSAPISCEEVKKRGIRCVPPIQAAETSFQRLQV